MDAFDSVSGRKRRFFSSKESTSFSATTATTFNGCIWFGFRKQTTIFFLQKSQRLFWRQQLRPEFNGCIWFGFRKKTTIFFLQKSQRLFRPLQLRHLMAAFDSVSGNKRRFLFFKRVNVFFGSNSNYIQWMHWFQFDEKNEDFFSSKESTSFFATTATTFNGCILFLRLF